MQQNIRSRHWAAELTVQKQVADDSTLVDDLRVRGLGLDEVLQKVGLRRVEVLVLTLEARDHGLDSDGGDVADVGRAEGVDGVLIEPVVQPGHLTAHGQVVDGLVGDGEAAVEVAAGIHVAEGLAKGVLAEEVPGDLWLLELTLPPSHWELAAALGLGRRGGLTEAEPLAELAGLARLDEPFVEVPGKIVHDRVHVGLHDQHGRGGVVAHDGALHARVLAALDLAEHVVLDLAVDHGAAVLIEVGLDPAAVGAVDHLGDLRIVDVDEVGPDAHDGAVLLVELLDVGPVVGRPGVVEPPEIGPSWCQLLGSVMHVCMFWVVGVGVKGRCGTWWTL